MNPLHTYPEILLGMAFQLFPLSGWGATEHLVQPGPHIRPPGQVHQGPRELEEEGVGSAEPWL